MKKIIIIALLAIIPYAIFGQNRNENFIMFESRVPVDSLKMPQNNIDKWDKGRKWAIGVQVGTDIGGAIPFPLSYVPSIFNPYPQLSVAVGVRGSWSYNHIWSLHVEATYKKVSMNADARVSDQRADLDGMIQYYTGVAEMNMSFTMVELPLYAKMAVGKKYNNFLLMGFYYAHNLKPIFTTTATDGYVYSPTIIENPDGTETEVIIPGVGGAPITPDNPMVMDFTNQLSSHDVGIILGYERRIWDRANIGLRLMVGFKDVFMADAKSLEYSMLQMRGSFVLEYDLFLLRGRKK